MKHVSAIGAALVALFVCGCAGSSNPANPLAGAVVAPRVEAVSTADGQLYDPANFQTSEQYIFQLVSYNAKGERTVLSPVTWVSGDENSLFSNIAGNSGLFDAGPAETATSIGIRGEYAGQFYYSSVDILPRQARLVGKVLSATSGKGVDGIVFDFYAPVPKTDPDAPQTYRLVGTATSQYDGSVRASVPGTTTSAQIRDASVPLDHYRIVSFGGTVYTTGQTSCLVTLPGGVPSSGSFNIGTFTLTPKTSPAPPISPCP